MKSISNSAETVLRTALMLPDKKGSLVQVGGLSKRQVSGYLSDLSRKGYLLFSGDTFTVPSEVTTSYGPKVVRQTTCPRCRIFAATPEEVEKLFGFRNMKRVLKDGTVRTVRAPQSHCKKCRGTKATSDETAIQASA